jgi:hypothetical protein
VGVGKGHEKDVARPEFAALAGLCLEGAVTARHHVKDADVMQTRQRRALVETLRTDDPKRRAEQAIEENRAGQPHGAQHLRQHVRGRRAARRPGKRRRRFDH